MADINVIVKEPGKAPARLTVANDLKVLQDLVGGYIEVVTLCTDLVVICNEEGLLLDLPYNTTVCGMDFFGTILFAGIHGDDFADCPPADDIILRI